MLVRRHQRERYAGATFREHDQYDDGSVMVWGGINHHQGTPLCRVDGNLIGIATGMRSCSPSHPGVAGY